MQDRFTLFTQSPGEFKRPRASSRIAWMRGMYVRNR